MGPPPLCRERLELERSNLACRFITRGANTKCKIRSKGVGKGSRDLLFKFKIPSISRELLEVETSHFACRFIARGTNQRNAKGVRMGTRNILLKFLGPRLYLRNGWSKKRQIWHAGSSLRVLPKEMQN